MAKILICDDAIFMREIIREVLTLAGHEIVSEAEDVNEAVDKYKKFKPDIVTMDILMKHPGIDAVRKIIAFDPKAKIVMVSVLTDQEASVIDSIRCGALGMVTKPIKRELLVGEVERVLKI